MNKRKWLASFLRRRVEKGKKRQKQTTTKSENDVERERQSDREK